MNDYDDTQPQLRMVWPAYRLDLPPGVRLPPDYHMRLYQPGDEPCFCKLMALAGWPDWDDEKLRFWLSKVLPDGWFMMVPDASQQIVATAMAVHNYQEINPFQGEIGWIVVHPEHRGKGLGEIVSAAATTRLIEAGYRHIHLYTEDFRLPALKVYLKVGYVPYLYLPEMAARWRHVCDRLGWPFTPGEWVSAP